MLESYRRAFAYPGSWQFSATGFIARMPISMMTLSIVVLVSSTEGSYGKAGLLTAAYIIGNAGFAILHGRLIDIIGQRVILLVDSAVFACTSALLTLAILHGWSSWMSIPLAVVGGMALPQIGAMVRSRWTYVVANDADRHTAFSIEAIVDEVVFILGPVLVATLAIMIHPAIGIGVACALGTVGSLLLALQRRTEPPLPQRTAHSRRAPMTWSILAPIAIGAITYGSLFGAMEVGIVALTEKQGRPTMAGVLLATFSAGSLLAGVVTGAMNMKSSSLARARRGAVALALGTLALPLIGSLWLLGIALAIIGLTLAPTLIAIFSLIESSTPTPRLNEALGVIQTGLSAGIAPGAWGAGLISDAAGGQSALFVCSASAVLAALAVLCVKASPAQGEPIAVMPGG